MTGSSVLVAGATGLVGRELLKQLRADPGTEVVHALARRPPRDPPLQPGLHWHEVDFTALPALPVAHVAVCALGTTIKAAGSQAAFRAVDLDAVLSFAQAAHRAGATRFGVVSALGANPRSATFYNRVKGEMEVAVGQIGFDSVVIVRPSLLIGDRSAIGQPTRPVERLAQRLAAPLRGLIPAAWRPIAAATVARALCAALAEQRPGIQVIESSALLRLGE